VERCTSQPSEHGCECSAQEEAVEDGLIPEERLTSYHRLTEELIFQSKKRKLGLNDFKRKNSRKDRPLRSSAEYFLTYVFV